MNHRIKLGIICAALVVNAMPAFAADAPPAPQPVPFALSAGDVTDWASVGPVFDRCIVAASLRGDVSDCRSMSMFLTGFAARVAAAKVAVPPATASGDAPKTSPTWTKPDATGK